jgi:sulfofructosephosphate aldolase
VTPSLDALARPSGTFLMVAMDQRESLRAMLAEHHGEDVGADRIRRFKLAVARELGPLASGFLIDRDHVADVVRERMLPPSCGLVVAADALVQPRGGVVEDTGLDEEAAAAAADAVALKLLVIWRDDERRAARVELARRFVELARSRGLLSVLEPVVRHDDREWAIVEEAAEIG